MIALVVNALIPPGLGKSPESLDTSAVDVLLHDGTDFQQLSFEKSESVTRIVLDSWRSSLEAVMTIFRVPHPTLTVIWVFSLYSFTTRVGILFPQYISLTLDWSLASVNSLLAGNALLSAILLFALPTVRKVYLEPRMNDQQVDLLVVKSSLILNIIGMAGFCISVASPLYIIALSVYTSGSWLYDSLTTFGLTSLPGDHKPAGFLVRSTLVQTIAGLVAAPFWSSIFSLCLKSEFLPMGLPFGISAALFGGTLVLSRRLRGQGIRSPST